MNNYRKHIISFLLFFIIPIILKISLPSLGSNNIIDLILRLTITSLFLLTLIYLFYLDIVNDLKYIKNNKKKSFTNTLLFIFILIISFVLYKMFIVLINQNNPDTILKIDSLYKKIPIYLFINNIILIPLIETIVLRYSLNKLVKNNLLFIVLSFTIFIIYYIFILNQADYYIIISSIILTLAYIKNKNILIITFISMIFNSVLFFINYL